MALDDTLSLLDGLDDEDHAALAAACAPGVALCTVVGIEGSFSRRLGAQLAIRPDGSFAGSLADGCLEAQLRADAESVTTAQLRRYGTGSDRIDFRLPCGGGLDILIDPAPDRAACVAAIAALRIRREAQLVLPGNDRLAIRHYIPRLRLRIFGEGPEMEVVCGIAAAAGISCDPIPKSGLSLGRPSGGSPADRWTAVVLLFHDHEWETSLLREALASDAFYVGAQGGYKARAKRRDELERLGVGTKDLDRLRSPVGTPSGSRSPQTLALAVLAEVTGEYERIRPVAR